MRRFADAWIAALVLALCGLAAAHQLGWSPFGEEAIQPVALGERIDRALRLQGIDERGGDVALADCLGSRFTVFYSWSVPCPCVEELEPRLRSLYARYNERTHGVGWVAIDGEPQDRRPEIVKKMAALHAFYRMLRDPEQRVCKRLGLDRAVQVAVVDREGRLLYRGAVDDAYEEEDVKTQFLGDALGRLVMGERPEPSETAPIYGCFFSDPASCEEWQERSDEPLAVPAPPSGSAPSAP